MHLATAIAHGDLDSVRKLSEETTTKTTTRNHHGMIFTDDEDDDGSSSCSSSLSSSNDDNDDQQHLFLRETMMTPLIFACLSQQPEIVRYLVTEQHANVDQVCSCGGRTALHFACKVGPLSIVQILIEQGGANVHVRDEYGLTPLHYACKHHCSVEIAKYLIEIGKANVNTRVSDHPTARTLETTTTQTMPTTPLHYALEAWPSSDVRMIEYLVPLCTIDDTAMMLTWKKSLSWDLLFEMITKYVDHHKKQQQQQYDSYATRTSSFPILLQCTITPLQKCMERIVVRSSSSSSYTKTFPIQAILSCPLPTTEFYIKCMEKACCTRKNNCLAYMDPYGQLPLHVALEESCHHSTTTTTPSIKVIHTLFIWEPRAATICDSKTGFYPFQMSTIAASATKQNENNDDDATSWMNLTYQLLRFMDPEKWMK